MSIRKSRKFEPVAQPTAVSILVRCPQGHDHAVDPSNVAVDRGCYCNTYCTCPSAVAEVGWYCVSCPKVGRGLKAQAPYYRVVLS